MKHEVLLGHSIDRINNQWKSTSIDTNQHQLIDWYNRWPINGEDLCGYWLVSIINTNWYINWKSNRQIKNTTLHAVIVNTFYLNVNRRTILCSFSLTLMPHPQEFVIVKSLFHGSIDRLQKTESGRASTEKFCKQKLYFWKQWNSQQHQH